MIQARTLTSEAEMRANAVAVRARCFYPKAVPKLRLVEPTVKPTPLPPPEVPSWKKTPTFFFAHIGAYRANVKIHDMIASGEIEAAKVNQKKIWKIVDEVLESFPGVTVLQLQGPSRTRAIIPARHRAMYEVRQQRPDLSYPEIGRWFGGRDHTTVLSAVRKMEAKIARKT